MGGGEVGVMNALEQKRLSSAVSHAMQQSTMNMEERTELLSCTVQR